MKFDSAATTNSIDQLKVVGQPVDRIEGHHKTTGVGPYAYDRHHVEPNRAYGYVVGSAIAKGRIRSFCFRNHRRQVGFTDLPPWFFDLEPALERPALAAKLRG